MAPHLQDLLEALRIGAGFLWTAGWAIIMGLIITSWVQVYVSKERIAGLLGEPSLSALARATGFGAASSGCRRRFEREPERYVQAGTSAG